MIRVSIREQGGSPRLATFDLDQVVVGRAAENDLCLTGKGVSGRHCRFVRTPAGLVLEDLGSTNGTFVNRERLTGPRTITPADEVVVAMYTVHLVEDGAVVASPHPASAGVPPAFSAAPPSRGPAASDPTAHVPGPASQPARPVSGPLPVAPPPGRPSPMSFAPPKAHQPKTGAGPVTDASWAREWEKIEMLSRGWRAAGKDRTKLLRGSKLQSAHRWLAASAGRSPAPKPEHREFIGASGRAAQLRFGRNLGLGFVALAVVAAVGITVVGRGEPSTEETQVEAETSPETKVEPEVATTTATPVRVAPEEVVRQARALVGRNPAVAGLLALEALKASASPGVGSPAERVLRAAVRELEGIPLRGHHGPIHAVGFSRDGRWALTAGRDQTARIWDLQHPGALRPLTLRGHGDAVVGVETTADSHWLFTAAGDGTIFRWDLTHPEPTTTSLVVQSADVGVTAMKMSADGATLVTGASDGSVLVWSGLSDAPRSRRAREGHNGPVRAVDITAEGHVVASAGQDAVAWVWRVSDGEPTRGVRLEGHERALTDVALAPHADWALTSSEDGTARLWEPMRRSPEQTHRILDGHRGPVTHVAITEDGALGLTAGEDHRIMVWDLQAPEPELSAVTFPLHKGPITALTTRRGRSSMAFSASEDGTGRTWDLERLRLEIDSVELGGHDVPVTAIGASWDGRWALTGASDGSVLLWDHRDRESAGLERTARGHDAQVLDVAVNPVGTRMVSASADGTARVWDLTRAEPLRTIGTLTGHKDRVRAVAIDTDGAYVATGGEDGRVFLWSLTKPDPGQGKLALAGHRKAIRQLAFTPNRRALVSISADRTARVWRMTQDPTKTVTVLAHPDEVNMAAISGDSRWLLCGTISRPVLWDLDAADIAKSGRVLGLKGERQLHEIDITAIGIGPRGRWAASASADPSLVLWDLQDGVRPIRLRRHDEAVDAVAFSPDAKWLATGSRDRSIRLWDLTAPHPEEASWELSGHTERVASLRFTPDGTLLVSGSYDHTLRVWPVGAGSEAAIKDGVIVLSGHGDLVSAFDITADGRTIVSGSYDGSARVWPLDVPGLVALGCRRIGRDLTPEEWSRVFPTEYRRTCSD